jgi:general secretion pathway protein N
MRIRLPIGRTLFFLGAFFLSLVALLPMRMAVDWFGLGNRGLAAREVQGSVWFGAFKEAQFATAGLGDLGAGLHALPLLVGRARVALHRREGAPGDGFEGAANVTRNTFGFDDVSGRLLVTGGGFGKLPLSQIDSATSPRVSRTGNAPRPLGMCGRRSRAMSQGLRLPAA